MEMHTYVIAHKNQTNQSIFSAALYHLDRVIQTEI